MAQIQDPEIKLKKIIVVDKPFNITSMDVIRRLRKILKPLKIKRIGHAGTLDPYATGVLVIGIGHGTKDLQKLMDQDKEYLCKIDLLKNTFSGDMENFSQSDQMQLPDNVIIPDIDSIENVIKTHFIGPIKQTPPHLSAIRINGCKAYDLVRKNIAFEMKERTVNVYEINIISYNFPILELNIKCSKGTYIRTLGKDIGKSLGFFGTLISLKRTKSGNHTLDDSYSLDSITIDKLREI